jgi:hypothetical protein
VAQLCQNFGISEGGFNPPPPPRYATALMVSKQQFFNVVPSVIIFFFFYLYVPRLEFDKHFSPLPYVPNATPIHP